MIKNLTIILLLVFGLTGCSVKKEIGGHEYKITGNALLEGI